MAIISNIKEATENARTGAVELGTQAMNAAAAATERASTSVLEQTGALASDLKERVASMSAGVSDVTVDSVKNMLSDFNATLPILKLAGYSVGDISVELGIPPKIVANFSSEEFVSEESIEEMLKQHDNPALASILVRALIRARKLQDSLKVGGLRPRGLALNIGISPSVVIKFGQ